MSTKTEGFVVILRTKLNPFLDDLLYIRVIKIAHLNGTIVLWLGGGGGGVVCCFCCFPLVFQLLFLFLLLLFGFGFLLLLLLFVRGLPQSKLHSLYKFCCSRLVKTRWCKLCHIPPW